MKSLTRFVPCSLLGILMVLTSCQDRAAKLGKGFRLPEGNVELGQAAFVAMECNHCHTVAGVVLPKPATPSKISYELGGEVRRVKTYGELVTAIIQPQHVIAPGYLAKLSEGERKDAVSPMPSFNDRLTVRKLTDIVTFLHSRYQLIAPPGVRYPEYIP